MLLLFPLQIKKRRGQGNAETSKNAPVQEPKPPRETHKLLQVWYSLAISISLFSHHFNEEKKVWPRNYYIGNFEFELLLVSFK